ncbi:DUF4416 family protein [Candidatus Sumerlaeota bacterium]|nr:DUF4416 family protein [Candidatus Sumerlaeota bacterium]
MGRCREDPPKVRLFFALMTGDPRLFDDVETRLESEFGPIALRGEDYDFDPFTDYYAAEFGRGLRKRFMSPRDPIEPERLTAIKRRTNEIETALARAARPGEEEPPRPINIDPGYLNLAKVVLATTKDHAHRLYVGQGIFEEVTLAFKRRERGFEPMEWTYADYRTPETLAFFNRLRRAYAETLKDPSS